MAGPVCEVNLVDGALDEHDGVAPDAALELAFFVQELQLAHSEHNGTQPILEAPLGEALVGRRAAAAESLHDAEQAVGFEVDPAREIVAVGGRLLGDRVE